MPGNAEQSNVDGKAKQAHVFVSMVAFVDLMYFCIFWAHVISNKVRFTMLLPIRLLGVAILVDGFTFVDFVMPAIRAMG